MYAVYTFHECMQSTAYIRVMRRFFKLKKNMEICGESYALSLWGQSYVWRDLFFALSSNYYDLIYFKIAREHWLTRLEVLQGFWVDCLPILSLPLLFGFCDTSVMIYSSLVTHWRAPYPMRRQGSRVTNLFLKLNLTESVYINYEI